MTAEIINSRHDVQSRNAANSNNISAGNNTSTHPMTGDYAMQFAWSDKPSGVREFLNLWDLPQVVKLHDGDIYGNFGSGTNIDVHQPFLLYSARRCSKVHASSLYWDDEGNEYKEVGPPLFLPMNYSGESIHIICLVVIHTKHTCVIYHHQPL